MLCILLDLSTTSGNADKPFGTHAPVICGLPLIFLSEFVSDRF